MSAQLPMQVLAQKASTLGEKKSVHIGQAFPPSAKDEKASSYILPAPLSGCCGWGVVSARSVLCDALCRLGLSLWDTRSRLSGLLALLHLIASKSKKPQFRKLGVPCSNRLARMYSSQLRVAPAGYPREALAVLVQAGMLVPVAAARVNQTGKASARYLVAPPFQKLALAEPDKQTNTKTLSKLKHAPERLEAGVNRRWPFRAQLLHDLALVTIPDCPRDVLDGLLKDKDSRDSTRRTVQAISTREHIVKVKGDGLIVTSLVSCPRELKPHLRLDGEPVALCDISSAHWMFLPRLIQDRLDFCRKRGDDEAGLEPMKAEMQRLMELCSSGSFYAQMCREGATAEDIKKRKKVLNVLMNSKGGRAESNVVWRRLERRFPHCFGIIESIKKDDHRNISMALQHFTASAITAALIELQARNVPCIPDTDCLIVRERDKDAACRAIGAAMHHETRGVFVTVGGIRYEAP